MAFRNKELKIALLASLLGYTIAPTPAALNGPVSASTSNVPLNLASATSGADANSGMAQGLNALMGSTPGQTGLSASHSGCFNHFNQKDACASPTTTNNCRPKLTSIIIEQFGVDGSGTNLSASAKNGGVAIKSLLAGGAANNSLSPTSGADVNISQINTSGAGVQAAGVLMPSKTADFTTSANKIGDSTTSQNPDPLALGGKNLVARQASPMTLNNAVAPVPLSPPPVATTSTPSTISSSNAPAPGNPGSGGLGDGICGQYNSETEMGVCLWSGSDKTGRDPNSSGWLSMALTTNCYKQVAVYRPGVPQPIVAKVLDGCSFETTQAASGCSQIYLTKKAFMALNPSPEEVTLGYFKDALLWDFVSRNNNTNTPV